MNDKPEPSDIRPITDDRTTDVEYTFEEIQEIGNKYSGILDLSTGILRVTNDEYGYFNIDS